MAPHVEYIAAGSSAGVDRVSAEIVPISSEPLSVSDQRDIVRVREHADSGIRGLNRPGVQPSTIDVPPTYSDL